VSAARGTIRQLWADAIAEGEAKLAEVDAAWAGVEHRVGAAARAAALRHGWTSAPDVPDTLNRAVLAAESVAALAAQRWVKSAGIQSDFTDALSIWEFLQLEAIRQCSARSERRADA
jgi:hypothetical protein